jgi:hypothetical protein
MTLPLLLFQFPANAGSFQLRQVIYKQLAIQMIDLMLDAHRQQSIRPHIEGKSRPVERTNADPVGSLYALVDPRYRQTTFFHLLDTLQFKDFRVNQA